jgi:microcin C transport system substrate-binding protein
LVAGERKFQLAAQAWRADAFPNPEVEYHSRLADVGNNNNITGFKDHRIDELCDKYDTLFDPKERIETLRELDGVLTNQYDYILFWYSPSRRILYWNKFGMPAGILTRTGDRESVEFLGPGPEQLWWIDPAKSRKLDQALKNPSLKLDVGQTDNRYWQENGTKTEN